MPKNFFKRLKESMIPSRGNQEDKSLDFERAKEILFSSETPQQLTSAVKYINNFNKKYGIGKNSPEFKYFERMILVMKLKIRSKKVDFGEDLSEGERMNRSLRDIIKESLDDFDWIKDAQSEFDPNFEFNGMEYWVDVSELNRKEKEIVLNYIRSQVRPINPQDYDLKKTRLGRYDGIIVHCGMEDNDYEAEKGQFCFMDTPFDEDENNDNSIYVDGREVLIWAKSNNNEEEKELEESLEWTDKDTSYETDKSFESDPTWTGDDEWVSNPERSYWKQGDAGGGGDAGGDMNESEEDPFKWMKDVEPDELSVSPDVFFRSDDEMYYTLDQLGHDITNMEEITMCELAQNYGYRWSDKHEGWYHRDEVSDFRDLNESQDLDWIKNVSDELPPQNQRTRVHLKKLAEDFMEYEEDLLQFLWEEDIFVPTEYYKRIYTPEQWDEYGLDEWKDGAWKVEGNSEWNQDPPLYYYEFRETLEGGCDKWDFITRQTNDYNLDYGTYDDNIQYEMIFERKKDGRYFALTVQGNSYDGIEDWGDYLYEVFEQKVSRYM